MNKITLIFCDGTMIPDRSESSQSRLFGSGEFRSLYDVVFVGYIFCVELESFLDIMVKSLWFDGMHF